MRDSSKGLESPASSRRMQSHENLDEATRLELLREEARDLHSTFDLQSPLLFEHNGTQRRVLARLLTYSHTVSETRLACYEALDAGHLRDAEAEGYDVDVAAATALNGAASRRRGLARFSRYLAPRPPRSACGLPVLSQASRASMAWAALILLIDAIYTAFWVPYVATFQLPSHLAAPSGAADFAVGLVLVTDIVVRFHTEVHLVSDHRTTKLRHPATVARFYALSGALALDAVAAVPLLVAPLFTDGDARGYLAAVIAVRVLRLVRVRRVVHALFYVQMVSATGVAGWRLLLANVASVVYTILVLANGMACLWYFVGSRAERGVSGWLAQTYKFDTPAGGNGAAECAAYIAELEAAGAADTAAAVNCESLWFGQTNLELWSISLYYVIITLATIGYGDITPTTIGELYTMLAIVIVGVALFGTLVTNIVEIMATSSSTARRVGALRTKLTHVQRWMKHRDIGLAARNEVLRFYADDWANVEQLEEQTILEELPTDVKGMVIWSMVAAGFKDVPLWSELQVRHASQGETAGHAQELGLQAQKVIASLMTPLNATRGMHFAKQGHDADCVYFLQRGSVEVLHMGLHVETFSAPATFGEAALLREELKAAEKHLSGYRTTAASMIWKLPVAELKTLRAVIPSIKDKLDHGLRKTIVAKMSQLSMNQLKLIKIFLTALAADDGGIAQANLDDMIGDLVGAVDMSLVTMLAYYDRVDYAARRGGAEPSPAGSAVFVPHHVPEAAGSFMSDDAASMHAGLHRGGRGPDNSLSTPASPPPRSVVSATSAVLPRQFAETLHNLKREVEMCRLKGAAALASETTHARSPRTAAGGRSGALNPLALASPLATHTPQLGSSDGHGLPSDDESVPGAAALVANPATGCEDAASPSSPADTARPMRNGLISTISFAGNLQPPAGEGGAGAQLPTAPEVPPERDFSFRGRELRPPTSLARVTITNSQIMSEVAQEASVRGGTAALNAFQRAGRHVVVRNRVERADDAPLTALNGTEMLQRVIGMWAPAAAAQASQGELPRRSSTQLGRVSASHARKG